MAGETLRQSHRKNSGVYPTWPLHMGPNTISRLPIYHDIDVKFARVASQ